MGRHRTAQEKDELGEQARAMRAADRSRREIQAELGIGDDLAKALLRGVELPDSLRRPQAKDDLRAEAVVLRRQGATYDQIAAALNVSKSSCSLWLRDLPHPERDPAHAAAAQERRTDALRARARRDRDARDEAGRLVVASTAAAIGVVTARDLVLAMAVSYWCEGAKRKPWNRAQRVRWMNSDPVLVELFLEGLALLGIPQDRLTLHLHLHERADEPATRRWWSERVRVPLDRFGNSTIKRHNPKTVRHNVGDDYRGCLSVEVQQSRELYQAIEGLVHGLATSPRCLDGWHDDVGGASSPDFGESAAS